MPVASVFLLPFSLAHSGSQRILPLVNQRMKQTNKTEDKPKAKKGFAAMDPKLVLKIAKMGGVTVSKDRDHMRRIGGIGGSAPRKAKKAA